jgi:phosphatidylserine/phosphatidylglycerophosphate/cardiolipin synthase-like enzyme
MDGADFFKKFLEDIAGAEKPVTIISPFISKKAVLEIIDKLPKHILFVTLPPGLDYLTGAVEPEAIEILSKNGFTIKVFPNIHAKLYIVDEKICYIGSANCTARGMSLIEDCNKEFMTKVDMQDEDFSLL